MSKYKICPSCGARSMPSMLECVVCEADLSGAKVLDEETERMLEEAAAASEGEPAPAFVKCECGRVNPPHATECISCGVPLGEASCDDACCNAPRRWILRTLDGGTCCEIGNGEVVLGREATLAPYLASKPYVSRRHAVLTERDGSLFIANLSKVNATYVNNVAIAGETLLSAGDEVGLGGFALGGVHQEGAAYLVVEAAE